jgi:hypothetical protein
MAVGFQVTFDAANPRGLGEFWRDLLGYVDQPPPPGHDSWESVLDEMGVPPEDRDGWYSCVDPTGTGARLFFQRVPEGKTAKNRVHLDVNVGQPRSDPEDVQHARVDAAVERAVAAGATKVQLVTERGEYFVVMADPEGNEFCLQ